MSKIEKWHNYSKERIINIRIIRLHNAFLLNVMPKAKKSFVEMAS